VYGKDSFTINDAKTEETARALKRLSSSREQGAIEAF